MSKFDLYLTEQTLITEQANLMLEAFGYVDDADAHYLGLPAGRKSYTVDDIWRGMHKTIGAGKPYKSIDEYMKELEKAYKGRMTTQDRQELQALIQKLTPK